MEGIDAVLRVLSHQLKSIDDPDDEAQGTPHRAEDALEELLLCLQHLQGEGGRERGLGALPSKLPHMIGPPVQGFEASPIPPPSPAAGPCHLRRLSASWKPTEWRWLTWPGGGASWQGATSTSQCSLSSSKPAAQ